MIRRTVGLTAGMLTAAAGLACIACGGSTHDPPDAVAECASESGPNDCVLCGDGMWHCGKGSTEPCPPDLDPDASSCAGILPELHGYAGCFTCNDAGIGELWLCGSVNGVFGGPWQTIPPPYAPKCTP
jgi:hypothetical protein